MRRGDDDELVGELGDLLLNVAYQVVLAEERSAFDAAAVVRHLERKMIDRHPHVYGDADEAPDWETLKAVEREQAALRADEEAGRDPPTGRDLLDGIPTGLEPLSRALRVQERAAGVGFDWPGPEGAIAKLREEIQELETVLAASAAPVAASPSSAGSAPSPEVVEEAGDLLFAVVNVCRLAGAHPVPALHAATSKFTRRFQRVAERAREDDLDLGTAGLEVLDRIWDDVKAEEAGEPGGRSTTG